MDKNKLAEEYAHKDAVYEICADSAHIGWFDGGGNYCKFCGSYEPKELLVGRVANKNEVNAFLAGFDAAESIANAKIQELGNALMKAHNEPCKNCHAEVSSLKSLITELEQQLKKAESVIGFYASPENWSKFDASFMIANNITKDDCADYPHITRDVRITGGKLARQYLKSRGE